MRKFTELCPIEFITPYLFDNIPNNNREHILHERQYGNFRDILDANPITTLSLPSDMFEIKENSFFRCDSRYPFVFVSDEKVILNKYLMNQDRLSYSKSLFQTGYVSKRTELTMFIDDHKIPGLPIRGTFTILAQNGRTFIRESITDDYDDLSRNGSMLPCNIFNHPELLRNINIKLSSQRKRYNDMTDLDFFKKLNVLGDTPSEKALEHQHNDVLECHLYEVHSDYLSLKRDDASGVIVTEIPWENPNFRYISMTADTTLVVDKDDNPAGGIFQRNRFVLPEFRGQGLGVDMVLFGEKNPAINTMGAGFYSAGGFATRKKAFEILKAEELTREAQLEDKGKAPGFNV